MTTADIALTAAAFLLLIVTDAYVVHRLNAQHSERIALRTYSGTLPGSRTPVVPKGGDTPTHERPPAVSPADRHDHRDGGRGRLHARRRRDRTTHKQLR
ncbi:hypothetical protein [Streptomyces aureocirculatus]|uniref:hypothetical protein n=1 Tax=Streptomyces aureocirculatus TaxID=67275 RepID=UPI00055A42E5|nr:hypothetical protein [Streptomyces aureocirculatus]